MKQSQRQGENKGKTAVATGSAPATTIRIVHGNLRNRPEPRGERLDLVELECTARSPEVGQWAGIAQLHNARGAIAEAARAFAIAAAMSPDDPALANMAAETARRAHDFQGCVRWAERATRLAPGDWIAQVNRAIALSFLGHDLDAEAAFTLASELSGDKAIIDWEWYHAYLVRGQLAAAYRCYERRFECSEFNNIPGHALALPLWDGDDLGARHLLVVTEQGLGDVIMFARALPDLMAKCRRLTLAVPHALVPLFAASFPAVDVVGIRDEPYEAALAGPWLQSLGDPDCYVPIGGLFHRGLGHKALPPSSCPAYLRPSRQALARWRSRVDKLLPVGNGLRVGICWASNPAREYADSARRAVRKSMQARQMLALVQPGVQLIGVLNAPHHLDRSGIVDVSAYLTTLDETAALIAQLDHIVSVDTSVAHLAGALGAEVSLLLPPVADARWGRPGQPLSWYANMHVERADRQGWETALSAVASRIAVQALGRR